jgi:acyl-CoA thioesterase-1
VALSKENCMSRQHRWRALQPFYRRHDPDHSNGCGGSGGGCRRGCPPWGVVLVVVLIALRGLAAHAQVRIMPLGDSITRGGGAFASYRYPLWFALRDAGYDLEFVGPLTTIQGEALPDNPNRVLYPDYSTSFNPHHAGYWGYRTADIVPLITTISAAAQPDIVLLHLGTNDIGQYGTAGVTEARDNLRAIIDGLRQVRPAVTVLLAQIIPIGPGNEYFDHAADVMLLNDTLAGLAADMGTTDARVILVDAYTDFNLATDMQPDGLHPNDAGEATLAHAWFSALVPILASPPSPSE